jgi:hypothetical protein
MEVEWQQHIEQHQVEGMVRNHLESLCAISSALDGVARSPQDLTVPLVVILIIIDDQDG